MLLTHLNKFFCYLGRAVKNDLILIEEDYKKVLRVIKSCKCKEHLDVTNKLITQFYIKNKSNFYIKKLKKRYNKKRLNIWY